jgi:hypothetical protein
MSQKKRRIVAGVAFIAAVGLLLLTASGALAGGPPVLNESTHVINETSTDVDVYPCTGQPAEITLTESGVIHVLALADGTVHITGTLRGTFLADLLPGDGNSGRHRHHGRLVRRKWGTARGGAFCKAQTAFTLNIKGTNADGTTFGFNVNGNAVFDPSGTPKLGFSKESARCR